MKKFLVFDGNALLHRAWHALPPTLTKEDGTIVNAVYGVISIMLKAINDMNPDFVAMTWDTAAPTFRDEIYEDYKGHRESKEDELYIQIPLIQEILDIMHIPNIFLDGFEADDLIGSLAKRALDSEHKLKTIIVTGDLDILQLVNDTTLVYALKRGISDTIVYDADKVFDRYELTPEQIIDLKALKGDPSDNIKGVKGIGEKTAISILKRYPTIEKLYEYLDPLTEKPDDLKPAQFRNLKEGKDDAFLSKELVTIKTDVNIDFDFKDAKFPNYKLDEVVDIFKEYEFKSLLTRIPKADIKSVSKKSTSANLFSQEPFQMQDGYHYIETKEACDDMVKELNKYHIFAFDTETTGIKPYQDELLGLSISAQEGISYYIKASAITDSLKKLFANKKIEKVAHQAKFDIAFLSQAGFTLTNVIFDTKIAAYLLNAGSRQHGLKDLAFTEFGVTMETLPNLLGTGKKALTMEQLAVQKPIQLADYACADADMTMRLYHVLKPRLEKEDLDQVFNKIDMPLVTVLQAMEENGIGVDQEQLHNLSKDFNKRIKSLEKKIYDLAGREFNINSPSQLSEILYDELKLPTDGIKKNKKGYSTAAAELDKLQYEHPIINEIKSYRELFKLASTYIDSLPKLINPKTQRIHTSFNQTVAATGRLSSSDPNLQNIPIRTEEGRKIRTAFIPSSGYTLVSADYSQFELRIVASLAQDKKMIEAFKNGIDIHKRTAASIFDIDIDEVTKEQRYAAKAINFGVIYGQGAWGLSQTAHIPMNEAKEFIEKYFETHHEVKNFLDRTKEQAKKDEYVETLFGRKRFLPDINSGVAMVRSAAERMAINMPVQGTQADILKMTMIQLKEYIKKTYKKDEVKMLLTVHDEVVFEIKDKLVDQISQEIKTLMEKPKGVKLNVPIKVDIEIGKNWGELEEVE